MERMTFESFDKDGNAIINEVIATYHDEELNKDFMIYTDKTFDEQGKLKIYTSIYEQIEDNIKLIEINDLEDKKRSLEFLQEILTKLDK